DIIFFSSRRRHTRSYGDWSSDVCSSDLPTQSKENKQEELSPAERERLFAEALERAFAKAAPYLFKKGESGPNKAPASEGKLPTRSEERRVGKECSDR